MHCGSKFRSIYQAPNGKLSCVCHEPPAGIEEEAVLREITSNVGVLSNCVYKNVLNVMIVVKYSLCFCGLLYASHKNIYTTKIYRSTLFISCHLIAERLSARLLILQCVFSVGGVWWERNLSRSGMQLKVWLVHKTSVPSRNAIKKPCVAKVVYTYVSLSSQRCSSASGLIVTTSKWQKLWWERRKKARAWRENGREDAVRSASRRMNTRESSST